MKILIAAFCTLLFICTSCSSADNASGPILLKRKTQQMGADVNNVQSTNYIYDGDKLVSEFDGWYTTFYTYTGNLITKLELKDPDGNLNYAMTLEYDSNERLIATYDYSGGFPQYTSTYVYNSNGTITCHSTAGVTYDLHVNDGDYTQINDDFYTFDSGYNPKRNILGWNKMPFYLSKSTHNTISMSGNGAYCTITYNSTNFPVMRLDYNADGSLFSTIHYYYE